MVHRVASVALRIVSTESVRWREPSQGDLVVEGFAIPEAVVRGVHEAYYHLSDNETGRLALIEYVAALAQDVRNPQPSEIFRAVLELGGIRFQHSCVTVMAHNESLMRHRVASIALERASLETVAWIPPQRDLVWPDLIVIPRAVIDKVASAYSNLLKDTAGSSALVEYVQALAQDARFPELSKASRYTLQSRGVRFGADETTLMAHQVASLALQIDEDRQVLWKQPSRDDLVFRRRGQK